MFALTESELLEENKEVVIERLGLSPRQIWQQLGEGVKPVFGKDIWIKLALHDLPSKVCLTDVRNDFEAEAIRSLGGKVIRLTGRSKDLGQNALHVTERGITKYDYTIENTGTLEELFHQVDALLKEM